MKITYGIRVSLVVFLLLSTTVFVLPSFAESQKITDTAQPLAKSSIRRQVIENKKSYAMTQYDKINSLFSMCISSTDKNGIQAAQESIVCLQAQNIAKKMLEFKNSHMRFKENYLKQ